MGEGDIGAVGRGAGLGQAFDEQLGDPGRHQTGGGDPGPGGLGIADALGAHQGVEACGLGPVEDAPLAGGMHQGFDEGGIRHDGNGTLETGGKQGQIPRRDGAPVNGLSEVDKDAVCIPGYHC